MTGDAERLADLYETLADLNSTRSEVLAEFEGADVPDWAQPEYEDAIRTLDEEIAMAESMIEDLGGELP